MTGTKCIQCRKRSTSSRIPELDEIVLAARHKETYHEYRRVPFNALDVPSMASKDTFLRGSLQRTKRARYSDNTDTENNVTNRDCIHGTSDFVRGGVDEFGTERCRRVVGIGFWG